MMKVFISGSISIRELPSIVVKTLERIIENKLEILVGDAGGVDALVQKFCVQKAYFNVTVYTIYDTPRFLGSTDFHVKKIDVSANIKKEALRQQKKDEAMTRDCDYCFIIWDEKSNGSYANIRRANEFRKPFKIYFAKSGKLLSNAHVTIEQIERIYRENRGYSAIEVLDYLKHQGIQTFKNSQQLYHFLLTHSVITKINGTYAPVQDFQHLFLTRTSKGRIKGLRFSYAFLNWLSSELAKNQKVSTNILN